MDSKIQQIQAWQQLDQSKAISQILQEVGRRLIDAPTTSLLRRVEWASLSLTLSLPVGNPEGRLRGPAAEERSDASADTRTGGSPYTAAGRRFTVYNYSQPSFGSGLHIVCDPAHKMAANPLC